MSEFWEEKGNKRVQKKRIWEYNWNVMKKVCILFTEKAYNFTKNTRKLQ